LSLLRAAFKHFLARRRSPIFPPTFAIGGGRNGGGIDEGKPGSSRVRSGSARVGTRGLDRAGASADEGGFRSRSIRKSGWTDGVLQNVTRARWGSSRWGCLLGGAGAMPRREGDGKCIKCSARRARYIVPVCDVNDVLSCGYGSAGHAQGVT